MISTLEYVAFASALGLILSSLASITTTLPGKLGAFFADTAIIGWLEDIGIPLSCAVLLITLMSLGVAG